jgi:hypothetical protein
MGQDGTTWIAHMIHLVSEEGKAFLLSCSRRRSKTMKNMIKKKKHMKATAPKKLKKPSPLEERYREYIAPMSLEKWSTTTNLSQPSILRQVPSKTAYSTAG